MTIDEFLRIMEEKFGEPNTNDFYDAEPVSDEENEEILREIEQMTEEDLEFSEMEPLTLTDFLLYFAEQEAEEAAAKEAVKAIAV